MVRLPALLAALALAAALVGCGGGGSRPTTASPATLAAAVRATQAAGSYTFTIGGSFDVAGQSLPIQGAGAVDARNGSGRASLDLTRALAATGIQSITPDEARAVAVATRGALYVRSPYLARRRGVTSPWMRFGALDLSPARLLGYLRAVEVVKRLGSDEVDGVKTTHYSTEVDLRGHRQAERALGDSLPVDVWVDAAGRVRRLQAQVATPRFQALPQIDFRGFGSPVAIQPPPARQVAPRVY